MINKNVNATAALIVQYVLEKDYEEYQLYKVHEAEYGFYLDFYTAEKISFNDFNKITKAINKVIAGAYKVESINKKDPFYQKAIKMNPHFKTYQLFKLNNMVFASYDEPLENTNKVKAILLTQIGGIEFVENKKKIQLTRIYVSAFNNQDDLLNFNKLMEELSARDHRKIGEDLKIFTFHENAGLGFPIWLPNGNYIKERISSYLKTTFTNKGFDLITTPILGNKELYVISGHWDLYKENNFPPIKIDSEAFMLRPMTCPHHMLVFNAIPKSYRDLPYKISEDSKLHRYESSGGLLGLERVRAMELFDSHIFCSQEMIEEIILELNAIILETHQKLDIKIDRIDLSLKDDQKDKYYDDPKMWKSAETQLRNILNKMQYQYVEMKGEAAFYGPKIDYQFKTTLGKWITISTIQLDFLLPKKFNCQYKDKDGKMKTPILIHFGVIGTYERFISALLSQTKGVLPFWLAPIQLVVLPVNNKFHLAYAQNIVTELKAKGYQVKLDDSDERLSKKIRDAQTSKIPYQIIIGDQEVQSNDLISFRKYGEQATSSILFKDFLKIIKKD
ncbi:MAG: threonine--tRNA ligase [Mycoplasmoidaceae bacterium]